MPLSQGFAPVVKELHIVIGSIAIGVNAVAGLYGAWRWWRVKPRTVWFWRLVRAGQAFVVIEAVFGGVLDLTDHKAPWLHVLYGLLPLLVAFLAEQLRIASAQMVLDTRGFESSAAVGELPPDEQRSVVTATLRREVGVMTLSALVVVGLLARAAATG